MNLGDRWALCLRCSTLHWRVVAQFGGGQSSRLAAMCWISLTGLGLSIRSYKMSLLLRGSFFTTFLPARRTASFVPWIRSARRRTNTASLSVMGCLDAVRGESIGTLDHIGKLAWCRLASSSSFLKGPRTQPLTSSSMAWCSICDLMRWSRLLKGLSCPISER